MFKRHKPEAARDADNGQSKKVIANNRAFLYALLVSSTLHAPLFCSEYLAEAGNIAYVTKERIARIINRPATRTHFIEQLKGAYENKKEVDLGNFYLDSEYYEGGIDEETKNGSAKELDRQTTHFKAKAKEQDVLSVLREMASFGKYAEAHTYLSSLLTGSGGNCEARSKRAASLVQRVYPPLPFKFQDVKLNGSLHTRTIVQVNGVWYAMDGGLEKMAGEDFEGTVVHDSMAYVKNYLGKKTTGSYVQSKEPLERTRTNLTPTDTYFSLTPKNIDELRDIGVDRKKPKRMAAGGLLAAEDQTVSSANSERGEKEEDEEDAVITLETRTPEEIKKETEERRKHNESIIEELCSFKTREDVYQALSLRRPSVEFPDGIHWELSEPLFAITDLAQKVVAMDENGNIKIENDKATPAQWNQFKETIKGAVKIIEKWDPERPKNQLEEGPKWSSEMEQYLTKIIELYPIID